MTIPPGGYRGPWGFDLTKDDHAEILLQHFPLADVLAFVSAREAVREIPGSAALPTEHDTIPVAGWDVDLSDLEAA